MCEGRVFLGKQEKTKKKPLSLELLCGVRVVCRFACWSRSRRFGGAKSKKYAEQRNPRTDRQAGSRRLDVLLRSTSTVYLAGTVCRRVSEIPVEAAVVGTVSAGTVRNVETPRKVHRDVCDLALCDCGRFSVRDSSEIGCSE